MRTFRRRVTRGYELDAQHYRLLEIACRSWDAAAQASATLQAEAAYYSDAHGIRKAHPAFAVRTQAYKQFVAAMRELAWTRRAKPRERHSCHVISGSIAIDSRG